MPECTHKTARYLDCDDCRGKGRPCPEFVCCDCGATIRNSGYSCSDIPGIFIKDDEYIPEDTNCELCGQDFTICAC